jgi:hypothetical protein
MEAKKLDFSKETVRIMDALDELQSALESLGEAMVYQGVLNGDLGIVAGTLDCGITDGAGFWYQVDNIDSLTDGYGIRDVSKIANDCYKDFEEKGA